MTFSRSRFREFVEGNRRGLATAWVIVGAAGVAGMLLHTGDFTLRGAPLPKPWGSVFFLSVWAWVGLRFIALWTWAWMALAVAPVALFVGMRPYLDAPWLAPLLASIVIASAATVAIVVWWYGGRKARVGTAGPAASGERPD